MKYKSKWKTAEGKLREVGLALGKLRSELGSTRLEVDCLKGEHGWAQRKSGEVEALASTARAEVLMMDHCVAEVNETRLEAEKRAFEACKETHRENACALTAEEYAAEAMRRASEAEEYAAAAEQWAIEVEERSKRSVEEHLASKAFKAEFTENAVNGFLQGFEEYRSQVQKLYLELDLSSLQQDLTDDED